MPNIEKLNLYMYDDGFYTGEISHGNKPEGYGMFWYKSGNIYVGSWIRGFPEGVGYFYMAYGGMYYGQTEAGYASGRGIYKLSEQEFYYFGEFSKGRMNGKGYANHKGVEFAVIMNSGKIVYSEKLTSKRLSTLQRFEDQKAKSALRRVFDDSSKMRYDYTGENNSETL